MACFGALVASLVFSSASRAVEVYPGPGGEIYRSTLYRVSVVKPEGWVESYTYQFARKSATTFKASDSWPSVNFTTFGTNDVVSVRMGKLGGKIGQIRISPGVRSIAATIRNGEAYFQMRSNDQFWIVVDGDEGNPLFIFADPPKPPVPVGATYFGPGVHDIGLAHKVADGESIYLDGGAWVKGTLDIRDRSHVTIMGPGVLSGEQWLSETLPNDRNKLDYCMVRGSGAIGSRDNRVDGITILAAPFYNFTSGPEYIGHVKLLSPWHSSTDGFQVLPRGPGRLALIEHCFAFVGDDVFFPRENFRGDIEVRDCFVSSTNNSIFQICYWGNPLRHDYRAYLHDIDIKNFLPRHNSAVFRASIDGTSNTGVKNMTFENIRIEGLVVCPLVQIENREYFWPSQSRNPESKLGNTSNFTFRNVTAAVSALAPRSTLLGLDDHNGHQHYRFENVVINGTPMTDRNYGDYFRVNEFTSDIQFYSRPRDP